LPVGVTTLRSSEMTCRTNSTIAAIGPRRSSLPARAAGRAAGRTAGLPPDRAACLRSPAASRLPATAAAVAGPGAASPPAATSSVGSVEPSASRPSSSSGAPGDALVDLLTRASSLTRCGSAGTGATSSGALDGPPPDPSAATADQALAGQEGLEPTTAGFGDRCATNCATALGRSPPPAARRPARAGQRAAWRRSEEHTSELQSRENLVCRLLPEKK